MYFEYVFDQRTIANQKIPSQKLGENHSID